MVLSGAGKRHYNLTAAYTELEAYHIAVHQHLQEAITLYDDDWLSDKTLRERIIERVETSEAGSDGVMRMIDDMVQEKHREVIADAEGKE